MKKNKVRARKQRQVPRLGSSSTLSSSCRHTVSSRRVHLEALELTHLQSRHRSCQSLAGTSCRSHRKAPRTGSSLVLRSKFVDWMGAPSFPCRVSYRPLSTLLNNLGTVSRRLKGQFTRESALAPPSRSHPRLLQLPFFCSPFTLSTRPKDEELLQLVLGETLLLHSSRLPLRLSAHLASPPPFRRRHSARRDRL